MSSNIEVQQDRRGAAHPRGPVAMAWRGISLPTLWAFTAVALPVVAALKASIATNDSAYQVRAGDIMLHTHHVLRADPFSFTAAGRPWLDQQWGAQVIFALFYRAGGWIALSLLRAALVGAIFLFVYLACRAAGAERRRAAWLALGSFLVSVGGLALRPQLIGMALFCLTAWLVYARRRRPRLMWAVPVVVALWANVHGSFFLGPLLLGLAFLEDLSERSPRAKAVAGATVLAAAAAALNPFGLRVWSYAVGISTNSTITRFVSEWQPPNLRDVPGAVFFASVLAVAALLARRSRPTPWPSLLSLGVFFLLGLVAVRGIFWWAFLAPVVVAALTSGPGGEEREPAQSAASSEGNPRLNVAIALAIVVLGIAFLPWWRADNSLTGLQPLVDNAPNGITLELRRILRPGDRIFNPVPLGSWFELALPKNPIFFDPRIEVFPKAIPGQFLQISLGKQGWQQLLDRWHVKVVVADQGEQGRLIPLIRRDPGWKLVYEENARFIFVRS
jgi:hypothetical protein